MYRAGTLTYTKAGLFLLFSLVLWGDFCLVLMQTAVPSVLQVGVKGMGAPNWVLGLVLSTIPGVLNMTICPAASFWSDRFRSRWGRRMPFLFAATIPTALFLALLGYAQPIGQWLHAALPGGLSQTAVVLTLVCVLTFFFQVFFMVISSVFYYLFNDVVPVEFLGRFMALFRVVAVLAQSVFNWFFLKYAGTHMGEIFLIASVLFGVAFLLMCWKVKEGEYPPPPAHTDGGHGLISGIKTFCRESFTHRYYWLFFLANTSWAAVCLSGSFSILQYQSFGVSLDFVGKTLAGAGILSALLMYPAGILADRLHPLRVVIWATVAMALTTPLWLVYLFHEFSAPVAHGIFVAIAAITTPPATLYMAAEMPMYMRILPKDRYGQFCSASAMVRSLGLIIGGLVLGFLLDGLEPLFARKDYCYRLVPVWPSIFTASSLFFLLRLQSAWKKHGGAKAYVAPGFEPAASGAAERTAPPPEADRFPRGSGTPQETGSLRP